MSEYLLIFMMVTGNGNGLAVTTIKLPSQQACIDAGVELMRLRGSMAGGWAKYSCTEIKGSFPRRTQ